MDPEIILTTDEEWSMINREPCRVINFTPLAGIVEDGIVKDFDEMTPYGSIVIECKKLPQKITGFITHKIDFTNLWAAFKERGVQTNEEVIIFWSKKNYRLKFLRFLPGFWPKLRILICPKGSFDHISIWDDPELRGMDGYVWDDIKIAEWKHELIK